MTKNDIFWVGIFLVHHLGQGHEGGGNGHLRGQQHPEEAGQDPHVDKPIVMKSVSCILDENIPTKIVYFEVYRRA